MTQPNATAPATSFTRREVLKTYTTPTITVIGLAATGSFATSGRVLPETARDKGAKGIDTATGKIPETGKGKGK